MVEAERSEQMDVESPQSQRGFFELRDLRALEQAEEKVESIVENARELGDEAVIRHSELVLAGIHNLEALVGRVIARTNEDLATALQLKMEARDTTK